MIIKKRGQVTIFMIIGIILLFSTALIFYIRAKVTEAEIAPVIEPVPEDIQPIRSYVEDCIYSTAVKGLEILGEQGGYINLSESGIKNFNELEPTSGQGVVFLEDSDFKIPYWYYVDGSVKNPPYTFRFKMPELESLERKGEERDITDMSIEAQVDRYVNKGIKSCISDFEPFKKQGFRITEEKLATTTRIAEADISIAVNYPLTIEKAGAITEISNFFVKAQLNLREIYNLAQEITFAEMRLSYLENQALNLIAYYSGLDKDRLPPIAEVDVKTGAPIKWTQQNVDEKLKSILMSYVPMLQIIGTKNYEKIDTGEDLGNSIFEEMSVQILTEYPTLSANFYYLGWPLYLDVAGKGGMIAPQEYFILPDIMPISIKKYFFPYDISFPTVVEITDPKALNEKGYSFMFALEANIVNNQPLDENTTTIVSPIAQTTMLCDYDKRNSANITIDIKDGKTNSPLEDVTVMFILGTESCVVGTTDANGRLKSQFPVGIGNLMISKPDYRSYTQLFGATLDNPQQLNYVLEPVRRKNVTVMKKRIKRTSVNMGEYTSIWEFDPTTLSLGKKDQVVIKIERIKDTEAEEDFITLVNFLGNQTIPSTIDLVPGKYNLVIYYIYNDEVMIPESTREVGNAFTRLFMKEEDESFTMDKIEFPTFTTPSQNIDDRSKVWEVKKKDLDSNKDIVMYAVAYALMDVPESQRIHEDMQFDLVENYTIKYIDQLLPEFK